MTFWLLAAVVGLAAFAVTSAATSVAVAVGWRRAAGAANRLPPPSRARLLLAVRLLPTVASLAVALAFVLPAFYRFEPRDHEEVIGVSLAALAAVGGTLWGLAVVRTWRAVRDTRRFVRISAGRARLLALDGLRVRASIVTSRFPLVAVVGLVRPRLLIADRVLSACTPRELRAVLAHEARHLRSRDNLKRLAMRGCPDLLALMGGGAAIERAWMDASEEAADDCAARAAVGGAIDLASALVKVARMATTGRRVSLPATALYRGDGIERRVRRLLEVPPPVSAPRWWRAVEGLALVTGAMLVAGAFDASLLAVVQGAIEAAVTHLP